MAARLGHSSRLRSLLVITLVVAGLVWGLTGALAADPSVSPGTGKVTLRVGWTTDPDNLNPFVGIQQSSYELFHVSYDFLTNYGDKYLETQPGLAESWTKSADGLTWTFKIRSAVKWSDGVPLTAKDIVFTYNWEKDLQLTEDLAAGFAPVLTDGHGTPFVRLNRTLDLFSCHAAAVASR